MRPSSSLLVVMLSGFLLCLASPEARGQQEECVLCRTESCEDKPTLAGTPWCPGHGPQQKKRRPRKDPTPAGGTIPVKKETPAAPEVVPAAPVPGTAGTPAVHPGAAGPAGRQPPSLRRGRHAGGVRIAKWVTLGTGAVFVGVGAGLWGIGGIPSCNAPDPAHACPFRYRTDLYGIPLVAVGGALLVTSMVLFVLDARHRQEKAAPPAPLASDEPPMPLASTGQLATPMLGLAF